MKKHNGSMMAYFNTATQNAAVQRSVYHVENIDAEKIIPNEKNFYSVEGIEEMANSLAVSDHMAPLEVVANGDGTYRLISGERRLSATLCRIGRGEIDKAELPCHVLPAFEAKGALSAEQVEMLSIIFANNYRQKTVLDQLNEVKQLEPIARSIYQEAKEKGDLTDENGANMKFRTFFAEHILSISKSALQRLQVLSQLTDEARKALEEGLIGKSVATEVAALSKEEQDGFVASIRAGECTGTRTDFESYLQSGDSDHEDGAEELYTEDTPLRTVVFETPHESPAADVTFEEDENEESPQEERHSAYDVTNASAPITEIHAADTATDEIVSVKDDTDSSNTYGQTEEKSVETLLEEEAGQERLITDDLSPSEASDDFLPTTEAVDSLNEQITAPEAVRILRELLQSMKASGRTQEAAAIDFALDTMKFRYVWISDPVEM